MKKFLKKNGAIFALALIFAPLSAPAAMAQGLFQQGDYTSPTTPSTWGEGSSIWSRSESSATASGYGSAWNNASGPSIVTRNAFVEGFHDLVETTESAVSNCGNCASGDFTGRQTFSGQIGQRGYSFIETNDGFAEGGTTAELNMTSNQHWAAGRQGGGQPPAPVSQPSSPGS